MSINKFLILILSFLIFTTSCQGLKDGLVGKKRSKSSDEFLVQKKNPLVLPPDFENMPLPNYQENEVIVYDANIQELFGINEKESESVTSESVNTGSIEKTILGKIKID